MTPTPDATPPLTPTRGKARVQVQSAGQIGPVGKEPLYPSTVLNVSMGGALIFTQTKLKEDALIGIELGAPIFPISRLVRARVAHVKEAPDEVLTLLRDRGRADKKGGGYLIGVEFTAIEPEDRQTLQRFIKKQLGEEKRRRLSAAPGDAARHTARERVAQPKRAAVPIWAWVLGFVVGLYEFSTGWLSGASDWAIALHVGAALAVFWFVGRIAAALWNQLEAWRPPEMTIIAHTDGTATNLDELLADADSEIDDTTEETAAETSEAPAPPAAA